MHRLTATQMNLRPIIHLEADLALNHIKENEGGRLDVRPGTEAARSVRAEFRRTHLTRCRFFQKKIARRQRTMPACNPSASQRNLLNAYAAYAKEIGRASCRERVCHYV